MRKIFLASIASLSLLGFLGACKPQENPQGTVTQVSVIDAVLAGGYDGEITIRDFLRYGDTGIGTFDRLDGEAIILDGRVYQVKADGLVYQAPADTELAYASIVPFAPTLKMEVNSLVDFPRLQQLVGKMVANSNLLYAIKVKGSFRKMRVRSVPAQAQPYPPLAEVVKNQVVFNYDDDLEGTLVGFYTPSYMKNLGVSGYHFHFLASDKKCGGHVLDFELTSGTVEIAKCHKLFLILPEKGGFAGLNLAKDRTAELNKAER